MAFDPENVMRYFAVEYEGVFPEDGVLDDQKRPENEFVHRADYDRLLAEFRDLKKAQEVKS